MKNKLFLGTATLMLLMMSMFLSVSAATLPQPITIDLEDGEYAIELDCLGGSGKASILSPTMLIVKDAKAYARIVWSSPNYDYMLIEGEQYWNLAAADENSTFEIPIMAMDLPMEVIGDTTAMGTPHEITYTVTFHSDSITDKGALPQEAAKQMVVIALIMIVGGGILNAYVKKKLR